MHFFFVDDSHQLAPHRPKMGPMTSVGGLVIECEKILIFENKLEELCREYGFPDNEIFKWSPGRECWMRNELVGEIRHKFFLDVIITLNECDCETVFIAEDKNCQTAANSESHEIDVVKLLIERVDWYFENKNSFGVIITDRPGGSKKDEESFLLECLETLKIGTEYHIPSSIIMTLLASPTSLCRSLQAADFITGCTLAYICGETRYSPPLMEDLKPLIIREDNRVGGVGIKLHPFKKYVNFYHWLFNDSHYKRGQLGSPLPLENYAFSQGVDIY